MQDTILVLMRMASPQPSIPGRTAVDIVPVLVVMHGLGLMHLVVVPADFVVGVLMNHGLVPIK